MPSFFDSKAGRITRYVLTIPTFLIVAVIVLAFFEMILKRSGSVVTHHIFPTTAAMLAASIVSSWVYPPKNKLKLIIGYTIFYTIMNTISLYYFFADHQEPDMPVLWKCVGAAAGFAIAIWFTKKGDDLPVY